MKMNSTRVLLAVNLIKTSKSHFEYLLLLQGKAAHPADHLIKARQRPTLTYSCSAAVRSAQSYRRGELDPCQRVPPTLQAGQLPRSRPSLSRPLAWVAQLPAPHLSVGAAPLAPHDRARLPEAVPWPEFEPPRPSFTSAAGGALLQFT